MPLNQSVSKGGPFPLHGLLRKQPQQVNQFMGDIVSAVEVWIPTWLPTRSIAFQASI